MNVTVCCCAGWISAIVLRFLIGLPPALIVSVTGTLTSWKSPESSTVATNERSAETFTVVAVHVERSVPCGVHPHRDERVAVLAARRAARRGAAEAA